MPTLAALVGTTAIVVGALAVRSSLIGLVDDADRFGQPWDLVVDADAAEQRDVGLQIGADPRVTGAEAVHQGELDLAAADGSVRQVGAIGLEGLTGPMWLAVLDGRAPSQPGEIAVGTSHDGRPRPVRSATGRPSAGRAVSVASRSSVAPSCRC